jgi:hypothetical protein
MHVGACLGENTSCTHIWGTAHACIYLVEHVEHADE